MGWSAARTSRTFGVLTAVFVATLPAAADARTWNEVAVPFEPRKLTSALYGSDGKSDEQFRLEASTPGEILDGTPDGSTTLFGEVWLPEPRDGNTPPARVPTVLSIQPYTRTGVISGDHRATVDNLVSRGYAYAQIHVRGAHESEGCWDRNGLLHQSDVRDMVEFVADASWSDGNVGVYGISNPGASAVIAAGLGDKVKAVIAGAPVTTLAEVDMVVGGVTPFVPRTPLGVASDVEWATTRGLTSDTTNRPGERQACYPDKVTKAGLVEGDYNDFLAERELRRGAANITVPILTTHGFMDWDVPVIAQTGFFEHIPDSTHKVGIFGLFEHEWPDGDDWAELEARPDPRDQHTNLVPRYTREDWQAMVLAWFDRYLKGMDTGVENWPTVQVQDTEGQWRAQDNWPSTDAPAGQLALGPGHTLGAATPTGSTSYDETSYYNSKLPGGYPEGSSARFEFDVPGRLEITGQPVADLWVTLDRPDAHLAVILQAFDPAGKQIPYTWSTGFRSAQHLDPYVNGRFEQRERKAPPFGLVNAPPVRVVIPLEPRDYVVPAGGKLVLTVAGSAPWPFERGLDAYTGVQDGFLEPSQLSGSATRVTILHDCDRTSVLRFQLPDKRRRLLNVREAGERAGRDLRAVVVRDEGHDAAGVASSPVCGRTPPPMTQTRP
jgi:predicted acyl esterase